MRKLLAVATLGVIAACSAPRFHHVATIAPVDVARITGRWSNVYLITKGDAAVLVDTGSPVDRGMLEAALASAPKLRAVIVTHAHADHAGGARWLQQRGAAIVLGAGDVPTAARGTNEPLRPTGLLAALLAPVFMFPFEPFAPDLVVTQEVDLGAYGFPELHVAPAAGHTAGELAVTLGDTVFVGDMIKGGEVLAHSPTEHLYQTDRDADHAALDHALAPGVTALYPGHGGRLAAGDVRAWLAHADSRGRDGALAIELDARAELPDGGATGGLRTRLALGGAAAYALGLDVRGGYLDGGYVQADAYPIGLALRGRDGALLVASAGAGLGALHGSAATRAIGELAAELPVGGARLLARGSLAWRLSGEKVDGDLPLGDGASALVGVRLGGDARWGDYHAGTGPFVGATYSYLAGEGRFGVALGLELFSGR